MSRQEIDYKVVGSDKDTGEEDVAAIRPVADGEPAQAAVFKRPSENLRTRTEVARISLEALNFLSDADRSLLLASTGTITWAGLPTGTFTSSANIILKPFTAPDTSSASRLLIGATTASQITIRTRQDGLSGQPRAYSGANAISFDFTPIDTGTGVVVITVDGTPADNFHVQYDSNIVSGTTVQQMMNYLNNVTPTAGGAAFVAAGLEAVVEGGGTPPEVGFPTPPAPLVGNKVIVSGPEQLLRFMAGAADAEQHFITPAHLTTFFADPLNQLIEGDVVCLRYDELVMGGYGGRRQSLDEFPEDKASSAGLNLFLMRRFPERLPGALPIVTVFNGGLIFVNNRAFVSGETGPLVSAGAFYQGSPTPPNSWADGSDVAGPISFETALDTIIQTLGTKSGGTPGAIKVGFTPSGNIAANTVKGALEELDAEKAGLALLNTFTRANTFSPSVATETGVTATGNTTGSGVSATGGASNGKGVVGQGVGSGVGVQGTGGNTTGTAGVSGIGGAADGYGVKGQGVGVGSGVLGTGGATTGAYGVEGMGGSTNGIGVVGTGVGTGDGVKGQGGANGRGVFGQGVDVNPGVRGNGGNNSGTGVEGAGGVTNGVGVSGQGAGSGAGVIGTGGATSGAIGVSGTGGSTDGIGVKGLGVGTGYGAHFTGGTTADGAYATGGATAGSGFVGQATGNGAGVVGIASNTNASVGVAGSSGTGVNGAGVKGTSTHANAPGVWGNGFGSAPGIFGIGATSSSGAGGKFYGGTTSGNGVEAFNIGGTGDAILGSITGGSGVKAIHGFNSGTTGHAGYFENTNTGATQATVAIVDFGGNDAAAFGALYIETSDGTCIVAGDSSNSSNPIIKTNCGGSGTALQCSNSGTGSPINLVPQGAPSSPNNGDMWIETGSNTFKVRINGVTKTVTVT